jgi:hypothetical protein
MQQETSGTDFIMLVALYSIDSFLALALPFVGWIISMQQETSGTDFIVLVALYSIDSLRLPATSVSSFTSFTFQACVRTVSWKDCSRRCHRDALCCSKILMPSGSNAKPK